MTAEELAAKLLEARGRYIARRDAERAKWDKAMEHLAAAASLGYPSNSWRSDVEWSDIHDKELDAIRADALDLVRSFLRGDR